MEVVVGVDLGSALVDATVGVEPVGGAVVAVTEVEAVDALADVADPAVLGDAAEAVEAAVGLGDAGGVGGVAGVVEQKIIIEPMDRRVDGLLHGFQLRKDRNIG